MVSSFFGWDARSTIIYWEWPTQAHDTVRDGVAPYYVNHLPHNKKKPRAPPNDRQSQIWEKFEKTIVRGYLILIDAERVENFIDSFQIPKGDEDIRVVLNGTSCGLTEALFAPIFWLL